MNAFTLIVTDESFEADVIQSIRPVLVYFSADWCEECRYLSPIVDKVAKTKGAAIQVAVLDVDENPRMARHYAIRMVPTMILFILGKEVERIEGVTNEKHLSRTIDMHVSAADGDISDESTLVQ